VSAYLTAPANPILRFATKTELRAEPSNLLKEGTCAVCTGLGAGALARNLLIFDSISTTADDDAATFRPDDVDPSDPGRWVVFGSDSVLPSTYVLRKLDGTIAGIGDQTAAFLVHATSKPTGLTGSVPTQAMTATLDFTCAGNPLSLRHKAVSTGAPRTVLELRRTPVSGGFNTADGEKVDWTITDGGGVERTACSEAVEWTNVIGSATAKKTWSLLVANVATERMSLSGAGVLTAIGFDRFGVGTLKIGGTNANGLELASTGVETVALGKMTAIGVFQSNLGLDTKDAIPLKIAEANATTVELHASGALGFTVNGVDSEIVAEWLLRVPRSISLASEPVDVAGTTTIDLSRSQNADVALTTNTSIAIVNAEDSQSGTLLFSQPIGGGIVVTMPADGSGVEYETSLLAMVAANTLISQTAYARTELRYYVMQENGRLRISGRSVNIKP